MFLTPGQSKLKCICFFPVFIVFKIFQMGPIFFILGSRKAQFLHFLQAKKRPTFPILRPIKFVAALLFYFPFYSYQLKRYLTPLYFDFIWVITWLLKLSLLKTLKVEFDMCQQIIPLCWKKITFITRIHDLLLCLLLPDCDCPNDQVSQVPKLLKETKLLWAC